MPSLTVPTGWDPFLLAIVYPSAPEVIVAPTRTHVELDSDALACEVVLVNLDLGKWGKVDRREVLWRAERLFLKPRANQLMVVEKKESDGARSWATYIKEHTLC